MTESDNQLSSLIFYMLVVHPVCGWILHPGRFTKRTAITYAVLFLAIIASAHVIYDMNDQNVNYYRAIGVHREAASSQIKKAFKRLSLELHPDKNPSPTAQEDFQRLKHVYDVLLDPNLRSAYNKLGEEGVQIASQAVLDNQQLIIRLFVSYTSYIILAFVMTISDASSDALQTTFVGILVMLFIEMCILFDNITLPVWFLPSLAPYELIWIIHRIFPAFMHGCRAIFASIYVNTEQVCLRTAVIIAENTKAVVHSFHRFNEQAMDNDTNEHESIVQRAQREHRKRPHDIGITLECIREVEQKEQGTVPFYRQLEPKAQSRWTLVRDICLYLAAYVILYAKTE